MKGKLNLFIGLLALAQLIYYVVRCPSLTCMADIFSFPVSGIVYCIFWAIITGVILFSIYKQNTQDERN